MLWARAGDCETRRNRWDCTKEGQGRGRPGRPQLAAQVFPPNGDSHPRQAARHIPAAERTRTAKTFSERISKYNSGMNVSPTPGATTTTAVPAEPQPEWKKH